MHSRPPRRIPSSLFALFVLGAALTLFGGEARRAHAGGFGIPGIGTRKTAMGAVIGRPDDLSAVYHNPAGLVLSPGTNLYLNAGLSLPTTTMRMRPWPGSEGYLSQHVEADGLFAPTAPTRAFGVIPMIVASTELFSPRAIGALSFYVSNAVGAAFPEDSAMRYHLIDSYMVSGFFTGSLAFRLTDWLSLGGGLSLIYVRVKADRFLFPVFGGKDLSGLFGKNSRLELNGEDLTAGFNLGVLLQPFSWLSLGATVISRSNLDLEGDVKVTLGEDSPGQGVFEGKQLTRIVIPWTFQLGVNVDLNRWVEVGAELRYYTYSQFKEQRTTITGIPLLTELLTPKNYRDSIHVSGGVKVKLPPLPDLELMMGMHFDRTPAPDETLSAEAPSFNHLGIHGGVRYRLNPTWRFSLTYVHYFYFERDVSGSLTFPPSNVRVSGDNNIVTLVVEATFGRRS